MIVEVTALAQQLAARYHTPWEFMTERVSEIVGTMAGQPWLYRERTGTLTTIGATEVRIALLGASLDGTMARQLTAWAAQ